MPDHETARFTLRDTALPWFFYFFRLLTVKKVT
jgi:hypothetical protein